MSNYKLLTALASLSLLSACGGSDPSAPAAAPSTQLLAQSSVSASVAPSSTFSGNLSQYTVAASGSSFTVTDNVSLAVKTVSASTRLRFADTAVALDVTGIPGQAYRMYQAEFNRKPDIGGLGFQMNALDAGFTLTQIAQNFIDSPEFSATYGALNTSAFVTLLYQNVLQRAPDAGGLDFYVSHLDGVNADGIKFSRAQVLQGFSESPENKALVLPAIVNGFQYTPFGTTPPSNPVSDFAGDYTGTFRGDDAGTLVLHLASDGKLTVTAHSTSTGKDLTGSGTVQVGGQFAFTSTGDGRTTNWTGSVNKTLRLATGSYAFTGAAGGGVFNATLPSLSLFPQVQAIVQNRCVPCHSAHPTMSGYQSAPLGITFDSEAEIRAYSSTIYSVAVASKSMPFGNATGMTDAERTLVGKWYSEGGQ